MSDKHRPGQYLDAAGEWQVERRTGKDRRDFQSKAEAEANRERRNTYRRMVDRERYERDHKAMIKDALDDFAEEHQQ